MGAAYELDSPSSHWLVCGMRRIERRNTHHVKPDNAAVAEVIAAIAQCSTASDDTAPIRVQIARRPKNQKLRRPTAGLRQPSDRCAARVRG
jgi:hypothetical protein